MHGDLGTDVFVLGYLGAVEWSVLLLSDPGIFWGIVEDFCSLCELRQVA